MKKYGITALNTAALSLTLLTIVRVIVDEATPALGRVILGFLGFVVAVLGAWLLFNWVMGRDE